VAEAGGNASGNRRRRVVIVGGGFGGVAAAHKLRDADVEVTLVDRKNHQLFQPLLYQVAAGGLASGECAYPIRVALRRSSNTRVLMAEASDVDVNARKLILKDGEQLDYDSLIVAGGAETAYFGNDEWRKVSCGLKTLEDAVELRNRFYGALEQAERATDASERQEWMTFVVIGGGPTGVEMSGQLGIITHQAMKREYANVDPRHLRIILLDAGERLVAAFGERLSAKVAHQLAALGVQVRERARATAIDERGVTIDVDGNSDRIGARTVIWAAGVRAVPLAQTLAKETGAVTDRAGRVRIEPNLTVPGYPEISAIGDMTLLAGPDGKPYPGLATVAIQQAHHVADGIGEGAPAATTPFRYFDKGALAVVGRGKAVCEIRGIQLSGRLAFFTYLGVHLYYLGGIGAGVPGHRLKVLLDWGAARAGFRQNQIIEGELHHLMEREPRDAEWEPASAEAGR
jgi:NADH:ubiquinone reductase (H+-translocating)